MRRTKITDIEFLLTILPSHDLQTTKKGGKNEEKFCVCLCFGPVGIHS